MLAKWSRNSLLIGGLILRARLAARPRSMATTCGFSTVETLHWAFRKHLQITPGQYRECFQIR